MKRKLLLVFMAMILLISMSGMQVSSARADSGDNISLLGIQAVSHKGVVFIFKVVGDFNSYAGTVRIGANSYKLTGCHMTEALTRQVLKCTAEKGLMPYVGQWATVTINGFSSSALIRPVGEYCYPVYTSNFKGPQPLFPSSYYSWGTHCQSDKPVTGDMIKLVDPGGHISDYRLILPGDPHIPPSFFLHWKGPGYYGPLSD